tara:strand:+ start:571 stop:738 length:168 start_codon:yes stop_codon:yes gene_type:complete
MTNKEKQLSTAIKLLSRAKVFLFGLSTFKDDPSKKLGHEIHQFVSRNKKNKAKGK